MFIRCSFPLLFAFGILACSSDRTVNPPPSQKSATFSLDTAFYHLSFTRPVDLQDPGDGSGRLFVVEQAGRILVFDNDPAVSASSEFLDIRTQVKSTGNEEGLLGLAFHPNYAANGFFYVYYTVTDQAVNYSRMSRFQVSGNPDLADAGSERIILQIEQPFSNHNGGQVAFGPDGYLYIGAGDGGSIGDPEGQGQNRATLLGSILRIDVDSGNPYAIPADNPFAGNNQGYREEIYAYGFRNPWRFSIDFTSGRLWVGDVGQNAIEEIDVIEKGGNYGWNLMEGSACYNPPAGCNQAGLTLPVWEYNHSVGRSITGGYVYRGSSLPELRGLYIYADYVTGIIWSLQYDGTSPGVNTQLVDTSLNIASFGRDANGELYICSFDGIIYKLHRIVNP